MTQTPGTEAKPPASPGDEERDEFFEYYAEESTSEATLERFHSIKDVVERALRKAGREGNLEIADIGCGAGTQSLIWAREGHRVHGMDINEKLIGLARERGSRESLDVTFEIGDAAKLSWADNSMDVCLVPELLEHVPQWETCLDEFARILRPGGVLYLSTNNTLCPVQNEFDLPLYSWYPGWLKRRYERLAVTTRPELVNHAQYPAVSWFNFYGLRREMARRGLGAIDRFDALDIDRLGTGGRFAIRLIRALPPVRWLAHVFTPYTAIVATRRTA